MRPSIIFVTAGLLLFAAGNAHAGHRHGHYAAPAYGHGYGHHYRHRHYGHRHHGRSHRRAKYLVGGLIAGAVLGQVIHRSTHHRSPPPRYSAPAPASHRGGFFLRDRHGDCYWVEQGPSGTETRTSVDPGECDW